jgi:hypothetical protein
MPPARITRSRGADHPWRAYKESCQYVRATPPLYCEIREKTSGIAGPATA